MQLKSGNRFAAELIFFYLFWGKRVRFWVRNDGMGNLFGMVVAMNIGQVRLMEEHQGRDIDDAVAEVRSTTWMVIR
jgi:hypothetical protein